MALSSPLRGQAILSWQNGLEKYEGLENMRLEYLESGPFRGGSLFFWRVGSSQALRIVGLALSSAAAAMASGDG